MCNYKGKLYGVVSTPATMGLHYNRRSVLELGEKFQAAGLDPTRAPKSIAELDQWAKLLDIRDDRGAIRRAGYLPKEPGWYISFTPFWFGGQLWNPETAEFHFTDPNTIRAFEWIQSYPKRLGKAALSDFSSAAGGFGTPNSPFIAGTCSMVLQGPWMGNYMYQLRPASCEWVVPRGVEMFLPRTARAFNYEWAAEAMPADDPTSLTDVTFADADVLLIPRGAAHPKEAFEFLAFVTRQDVMERLNSMHCKPSPLAKVSDDFIRKHPNPYISVHERMAFSPNARPQIKSPMQAEIAAEYELAIDEIYLLSKTPRQSMTDLQKRARAKYDAHLKRQALRQVHAGTASESAP